MRTRCFLLFLFLNFIAVSAFSQTDSLKIRRTEIGADFLPILKGSGSAGIILRRHQEKAAWRLRVDGSFSSYNLFGGMKAVNNLEANLRWGREWHLPYKKFKFYYGLDLLTGYRYEAATQTDINRTFKTHEPTLGLLPLVGCTYKFDERFSASVETNGNYSVTMRFSDGKHWNEGRGIFISGHAFFLSYWF